MQNTKYNFLIKKNYNQFTGLFNLFIKYLFDYPVFTNLGIMWNFGFASFFFLTIQLLTGFLLSMHYIAHSDLAFLSVEQIMRDVNFGWLLRYLHANGASFFFLCVYLHILRSLYYSSYFGSRKDTWTIGVVIFVLLIATAFTGYVLPWGQMSFWAATVITNLFSAVPFYGQEIVHLLWGGFSVNSFTLTRFFSLHFILPFIILACVVLHIIFLHFHGGNNKFQIFLIQDKIKFFPFYLIKDFYYMIIIFLIFFYFIGFIPNYLLHVDNYVPADPLVTPPHIVPEWYFLIFYAILRSIPSKVGGILILLLSILILFFLPYFKNNYLHAQESLFYWTSRKFILKKRIKKILKYFYNLNYEIILFWIFFVTCVLLGYIGSQPIEIPYLLCGRLLTIVYFLYFFFLFLLNKNYNKQWL
jgi:quinol-cytochrome oxidoreductase complex cytochrome b subunit